MSQEILEALQAEKEKIEEAIAALEGGTKRKKGKSLGRPKGSKNGRRMSNAAKKRLSIAAKKRWIEAKKAGKTTL